MPDSTWKALSERSSRTGPGTALAEVRRAGSKVGIWVFASPSATMTDMFKLTKRLKFEAAHRIPGHPGKCDRLHGHTYMVDVEVTGADLDALGILIDFNSLKELELLLPDHTYLNDALPGVATTAEGLSRHFYQVFKGRVPQVSAVTIHEGPNSWCRFEET